VIFFLTMENPVEIVLNKIKPETMKKFFRLLTPFLITLVVISLNLDAQVKLPAIFGDNMVLQQQTDAAIWGKAGINANVRISTSWNGKSYTARADKDGNWKTKVSTPSAGGPYTVTISESNTIVIKNVMIGEVWVCSGQSNMEMTMKGYRNQPVNGSNEYIATSSNNQIRFITIPRTMGQTPQDNFKGEWKVCEPENVVDFSATGYFFGLMLNKILKVPVGLISTSWGGTRIEPWISETGLKKFDWLKLPDKTQPLTGTNAQQTPAVLFNAMINPIVGYGIKGAIWYQGEANRNEPAQYQQLLPGLVENWRSVWNVGDFSFYYVQIAPYDYGPTGLNSAFLREAQLKASTAISNIGMACVMDTGEKDIIHPSNKKAAGDRLAFQALVKTYGKKGIVCDGPVFKEMKVEGSIARLTFDNAPNGLIDLGRELTCFEAAGANKRFYPAKAFVTNAGITIFCQSVAEIVAVRYAFKDFIVGDLFNNEGLPASSFRTDTWDN
jgi:sialate O-acetylesterase